MEAAGPMKRRRTSPPPFKIIEHTADTGFEVYGRTLAQLYENAGLVLFHLLWDSPPDPGDAAMPILVSGRDREELLVSQEGIVSPGGVGYDINCGVRLLRTTMVKDEVAAGMPTLVDRLFRNIPTGVGSRQKELRLGLAELKKVLRDGAGWAVKNGLARPAILSISRRTAGLTGPIPDWSPNMPWSGARPSWEPWARATISPKSVTWTRSSTRNSPGGSGCFRIRSR
jgi:hypothetical protein